MLTRTLAIGTAVLCLLCSANWGHASLVVIQPGAEGKDTWVSSANGNDRHENAINLTVGLTPTRYTLIQFDLAQVPSGSTINYASLWLYRGSGTNQLNVSAHEIAGAWLETVTYNTLPTWNAAAAATASVGSTDAWYSWSLTTLAQKWVTDPTKNYGVLFTLDAADGRKDFFSSDRGNPNAQYRPTFEIDYTAVPIPPSALLLGSGLAGLVAVRRRFWK